jgi:hypothetical protein
MVEISEGGVGGLFDPPRPRDGMHPMLHLTAARRLA